MVRQRVILKRQPQPTRQIRRRTHTIRSNSTHHLNRHNRIIQTSRTTPIIHTTQRPTRRPLYPRSHHNGTLQHTIRHKRSRRPPQPRRTHTNHSRHNEINRILSSLRHRRRIVNHTLINRHLNNNNTVISIRPQLLHIRLHRHSILQHNIHPNRNHTRTHRQLNSRPTTTTSIRRPRPIRQPRTTPITPRLNQSLNRSIIRPRKIRRIRQLRLTLRIPPFIHRHIRLNSLNKISTTKSNRHTLQIPKTHVIANKRTICGHLVSQITTRGTSIASRKQIRKKANKHLFPPIRPFSHHVVSHNSNRTVCIRRYNRPTKHPIVILRNNPNNNYDPIVQHFFSPSR